MTTEPSIFSMLKVGDKTENIFEDGDVGLILKVDGTVRAISAGFDTERLKTIEPKDYTQADFQALNQATNLMALTLAANNPQLMQILTAVLDDPTIASKLHELANLN